MPLPYPTLERELLHIRTVTLQGYRRKDQLWDIEGHLTDVRTHDVQFPGGQRSGGDPIHDMWIRLTVDATGLIKELHVATDAVPFEDVCGTIRSRYRCLIGVRVGSGFRGQVRRLLGGLNGCTHLTELLLAMGTTVIQTLSGEISLQEDQMPLGVNGCHALNISGPVVAEFHPRWYRPSITINPVE